MPPTLLLIRHAQALHNVASDWSIHDPPLSELGERQCQELQESLKNSDIGNKVELIVVSSMRRTLQTASIGLQWLIKDKGIKVLPDAGWQGELRPLSHSLAWLPTSRRSVSASSSTQHAAVYDDASRFGYSLSLPY